MSETTQQRVERDPDEHPLAERLAAAFHRHYEDLAPLYGYKTREATAVPWEDVPENNKLLMIAVADTILRDSASPLVHLLGTAIEALREIAERDWTEPPIEMPDEIARAALAKLVGGEEKP